jgi:hypothetical protein
MPVFLIDSCARDTRAGTRDDMGIPRPMTFSETNWKARGRNGNHTFAVQFAVCARRSPTIASVTGNPGKRMLNGDV